MVSDIQRRLKELLTSSSSAVLSRFCWVACLSKSEWALLHIFQSNVLCLKAFLLGSYFLLFNVPFFHKQQKLKDPVIRITSAR